MVLTGRKWPAPLQPRGSTKRNTFKSCVFGQGRRSLGQLSDQHLINSSQGRLTVVLGKYSDLWNQCSYIPHFMDVTREIKGIPKVAHSVCPPEFFPPPLSFLRVIEFCPPDWGFMMWGGDPSWWPFRSMTFHVRTIDLNYAGHSTEY